MINEYHRHGMMETMFLPIDIHKETTLESKQEDNVNEHEAISLTPHQICAHMRNLLNQLVSLTLPHTRSSTPLILPVHKDFKRVVVDAYVYHKYCKSHWHES
jgi:hypothetical protein